MANIERGEVELVVGDESYTLKLSMNAAVQLEARQKRKIGEILNDAESLDFTAIRDIVWVLLQKFHAAKFKTPEAVGNFMDEAGGAKVFFETLAKLAAANKPEGTANPPVAPTTGTGGNSTETPAESA
jgi:hypothetical protein